MTELLSIKELAGKIKVSKYTIYKWTKERKIPYLKMPGNDIRFDKEKIDRWLESRTVNKKAVL